MQGEELRGGEVVTCGPDVSHFCLTVVVPMAAHDKGGEFYLDQVPFVDIDRGLAPFSAPRIAFNNERQRLNEVKRGGFFSPLSSEI